MGEKKSPLSVGVNEKMSIGSMILMAIQHLLGITFLLAVPGIIGGAIGLEGAQIGAMVQSCFITAGLVTVLQSIFILKLPAVHGPTALFMSATISTGAVYGLGTAFGSMFVAACIVAVLSIPIGKIGLIGKLTKFLTAPIVFGTLMLIIGTQLAQIAIPGCFSGAGSATYPWVDLLVVLITILVTVAFMIFGKKGIVKQGAMLWGIIAGTIVYACIAGIDMSGVAAANVFSLPQIFPYGFDVNVGVVILMILGYFHSSSEALGMYNLLAGWDNQEVKESRANGGIFGLALGNIVGAAIGGVGTTTYPENVGVIRVSGVGSRFATLVMGVIAVLLGFFPKVGMLIAVIPSPVLNAATIVLFGMIAFSGVQNLKAVEWDDLNVLTGAIPYIIAIGTMFLPADFTAMLPAAVQSIVTQPMLVGIILLVVLNAINNMLIRPFYEKKKQKDA